MVTEAFLAAVDESKHQSVSLLASNHTNALIHTQT